MFLTQSDKILFTCFMAVLAHFFAQNVNQKFSHKRKNIPNRFHIGRSKQFKPRKKAISSYFSLNCVSISICQRERLPEVPTSCIPGQGSIHITHYSIYKYLTSLFESETVNCLSASGYSEMSLSGQCNTCSPLLCSGHRAKTTYCVRAKTTYCVRAKTTYCVRPPLLALPTLVSMALTSHWPQRQKSVSLTAACISLSRSIPAARWRLRPPPSRRLGKSRRRRRPSRR